MRGSLLLVVALSLTNTATASRDESYRRVCQPTDLPSALPMRFEPNMGQADRSIRFIGRQRDSVVLVRDRSLLMLFAGSGPVARALSLRFAGAAQPDGVYGADRKRGVVNYLPGRDRGGWLIGIPTYGTVRTTELYPGLDVCFVGPEPAAGSKSATGGLRFDVFVKPGGDPRRLRVALDNATRIHVDARGRLVVRLPWGVLHWSPPAAYQELRGRRVSVACAWSVLRQCATAAAPPVAGFRVAQYDRSRPLVIDPTLDYSTFLGGGSEDRALAIATDDAGCAYVTGYTYSTNFPTTSGAYDPSHNGQRDVFVTKITSDGSDLVYSTFLGGTDWDEGRAIAVDGAGNAYVAGATRSSNYPVTGGAHDGTYNGGVSDAFVTKLSPSGSSLVYSTFLGGGDGDEANGLAVDGSGSVYVTGQTQSEDFPTTPGAYDTDKGAYADAFVTKLHPDGGGLAYSTFLGGGGTDTAYAIALDGSGRAVVCGVTHSSSFPTTAGAYDTTYNGDNDGFVTKLSGDGSALVFSTYLGGSGDDALYGAALDNGANVYVTGETLSSDYPVTYGAFDTSYNGSGDALVSKLDNMGATLAFSTYLGGSSLDQGHGISLYSGGQAIVGGTTLSTDFPVTSDAYDTTQNGAEDVFVSLFSVSGDDLRYSTFVGGTGSDSAGGIALAVASAYVCGTTSSDGFPTTEGAYDRDFNGGTSDTFVLRFRLRQRTQLQVTDRAGAIGQTVQLSATLTRASDGAPISERTITFRVANVEVGSSITNTSGVSTLDYYIPEDLGTGDWPIAAQFAGDDEYEDTSGTGTLSVSPAPTTTTTLDREGIITEAIILRGYLRRTTDNTWLPGRTILFSVDGTEVGWSYTNDNGRADLAWVISDGPEYRTIRAEFGGDSSHEGSYGTAALHAMTVDTKMYGLDRTQRITGYTILKAYLYRLDNTPVANKRITFKVDGSMVGESMTISTGRAQIGYTVPDGAGAGTRTILAEWAGDGGYRASSRTNTLTVLKAKPYIWVCPKRVPYHGLVSFYVYFRRLYDYKPVKNRPLEFAVDGTPIGNADTDDTGVARLLYQTVEEPGAHVVTVVFNGDSWIEEGTGTGKLTIY